MSNLMPIADVLFDAEVFTDGDWVETKDQDPEGDVRLTQLADVGDGKWINKSVRFLTSEKAKQLRCTYLRSGDLLIARMPDPLGRCCVFPGDSMPCVTVVDVCVIRPNQNRVDNRYLMHVINAPHGRRGIARHMTGTTRRRVSRKNLSKVEIPLPPLPEQKRIAGILDAADALRAKRREALAQLDTLLQSTFLDMFGDPVTNPLGWPATSLSAISEQLTDGPFGSNLKTTHYVERGVRVIRLQNIGVGELLNDDLAYISEGHFASLPRNHCRPDDVIIGTMGDPNLRACIVPTSLPRALNKADCILMRVDMTRADHNFVCWLLNNPSMVAMALQLVRGQTRGRISLGRLKELQIYLPPMDLQHRFTAIVESVERQKASQRAHLAELDTLFASLQSRAFRGDL